jgi:hypothetical protein
MGCGTIAEYTRTSMRDEAEITINGIKLPDAESETMRVAIDSLANVLAEGVEAKDEGIAAALTERYLVALVGIQKLLDSRPERMQ